MTFYEEFISDAKIIVTIGAGGVGKTTSSIAVALAAALEGKVVGLLSIDPAKRLAQGMGLNLGSDLSRIQIDSKHGGELWAAMLDQKAVFDEMVFKFTKSEKTKKKIMANSLYQAASSKFGGALEYMALAKLQSMVESEKFDLIVLDTPPDTHALDFLSKPSVLSGFLENKVMAWLIKPIHLAQKMGLSKIMMMGEKLAGGLAEVTGVKALQVLAEFLVLMQDTITGLHGIGDRIVQSLHSETTKFMLVTTLRSAPIRSVHFLADQLEEQGFSLHCLLINRVLPDEVCQSLKMILSSDQSLEHSKEWLETLSQRVRVADVLNSRLNESISKEFPAIIVKRFNECSYEIHSLKSVQRLARELALS